MEPFTILLWFAIPAATIVGIFALDRLGLYLERRGLLFYRHKKPSSSAAGCFVAAQKFIEPGMEHVINVKESDEKHEDESGDPEDRLIVEQ